MTDERIAEIRRLLAICRQTAVAGTVSKERERILDERIADLIEAISACMQKPANPPK